SFWRLNLAGWAAYAVAMSASRVGRFPFAYMIATKSALAIMGLVITGFLLRPLYRWLLSDDPPLKVLIVVTTVASYAAAVLWTAGDGLVDLHIVRALLN